MSSHILRNWVALTSIASIFHQTEIFTRYQKHNLDETIAINVAKRLHELDVRFSALYCQ